MNHDTAAMAENKSETLKLEGLVTDGWKYPNESTILMKIMGMNYETAAMAEKKSETLKLEGLVTDGWKYPNVKNNSDEE